MRRKLQLAAKRKRDLKKKELEEKKKLNATKRDIYPYERKHGKNAEIKRINSLGHLTEKEKKKKINSVKSGVKSTSSKKSSSSTTSGAERAKAMFRANKAKGYGTGTAARKT